MKNRVQKAWTLLLEASWEEEVLEVSKNVKFCGDVIQTWVNIILDFAKFSMKNLALEQWSVMYLVETFSISDKSIQYLPPLGRFFV